MDEILMRLEDAVRRADRSTALGLIAELRHAEDWMQVLWATVECVLIELDASDDQGRLVRFAQRVRAGFDHDAGQ